MHKLGRRFSVHIQVPGGGKDIRMNKASTYD